MEAIKVANAELRMLGELKRLNSRRKTYTIRDTLLTQALNSVFQNTVTLGTGLILLIAASSMRSGSFTIGDFALFVSYLYTVGWLNTEVGNVLAEYRQTGVSFDRLRGADAERRAGPSRSPPTGVPVRRDAGGALYGEDGGAPPRLGGDGGADLPVRRRRPGDRGDIAARAARVVHGGDRQGGIGQDDAAPGAAGAAAQGRGRGPVERGAG